jgi:hypothetical protein
MSGQRSVVVCNCSRCMPPLSLDIKRTRFAGLVSTHPLAINSHSRTQMHKEDRHTPDRKRLTIIRKEHESSLLEVCFPAPSHSNTRLSNRRVRVLPGALLILSCQLIMLFSMAVCAQHDTFFYCFFIPSMLYPSRTDSERLKSFF